MDTTLAFSAAGIIASNLITIITLYKCDKTLRAIHAEMKDFHGRLISIEERMKE